jgi:acyl-coenzyme A synthetase/AMP-(fatty) acid ligase
MCYSYETDYQNHRIDVPERFNPVIQIVDAWAAEESDAPALLSLGSEGEIDHAQTIAELSRESRRMAQALLSLGVKKGDRVLIMMPRVPAWYTAMLGVMRFGAVAIPTPNLSTARDIAYRVKTAAPIAIIADGVAASKIDTIRKDLSGVAHAIEWSDPRSARSHWLNMQSLLASVENYHDVPVDPTSKGEPLLIFFTSGTVSYPKMVLHDQSYALGHVGTARYWHNVGAGDRHWTVSDTGWAKAAWGGLFGQWHERATVVQANLPTADAHTILSIIRQHRITSFCAPPTLYRSLVQLELRSYDLTSLRQCTSAGEPLNPEVIKIWKNSTGLTVRDGFGQSETTAVIANTRNLPVRPGSMGKTMPGYQVDIVDNSGALLAAGEVGCIAIRTEPRPLGLCLEYLDSPERTTQAFRNGYYYTGDRGSRDSDGYFWFESRDDDVINSSAYRIGPFEVESALIEHTAVVEAAVVGKDDAARTQIVCAFVVLASAFRASPELIKELQDHVKRETAPYKYPREIHFVGELPKTISGKIRRSELRRWLRDGIPHAPE